MSSFVRISVAIVLALLSLGILLPTAIAVGRNHPRTVSVVVWNTLGLLLLGIGWLVALVIALTDGSAGSTTVIVQNSVSQVNGKTH